MNKTMYQAYTKILKEELMPAMGCTEPIAIAYCAAYVRDVLGHIPTDLDVWVSPDIIKNVKSVKIPSTNGLHGIDAAVGIGILAGNKDLKLEVLSQVTNEQINKLPEFLAHTNMTIKRSGLGHCLYIEILAKFEDQSAKVIIKDAHTNVCLIEKNGEVIFENTVEFKTKKRILDGITLSIESIYEFAKNVKIEDIREVLDHQIDCNMKIAEEGLNNSYGPSIGKTILKYSESNIIQYVKALAAAASDARMNGCEMPVVINSGSGNQGITSSVPVIAYAQKTNKKQSELYRALVVSNLTTIHIKAQIGKLSAFCGVVIAGAGCGAGIAFLEGSSYEVIANTIINALGIISGVVCDGAKSSCAAKIASSVEAGILGYNMAKDGNYFYGGDGIIKDTVEDTIKAIGELARVGMSETDKEIIHLMID